MILIICKKYFTQILFYYLIGEYGVIIYRSGFLTKKAYPKTAGFWDRLSCMGVGSVLLKTEFYVLNIFKGTVNIDCLRNISPCLVGI